MSDPVPPFDFAVDPEARLAYGRLWGTVTGRDMHRLAEAVHTHPAWQDGFDALWDCSAVDSHVVALDELPPLVAEEVSGGDGRDALLESPSSSETAISNLIATLCRRRGKEVQVYASLPDALRALGRDALPASVEALRATPHP